MADNTTTDYTKCEDCGMELSRPELPKRADEALDEMSEAGQTLIRLIAPVLEGESDELKSDILAAMEDMVEGSHRSTYLTCAHLASHMADELDGGPKEHLQELAKILEEAATELRGAIDLDRAKELNTPIN